ncbi:MAG TPA: HNH endonuclease, partial [Anaeromyxobacter sp.]
MTNAHELTRRLQDLLARERVAMADFLVAVADFDRRALWLELGYASLFEYLNRELGLSKASTFLRVRAVGLIQRFPDVLEALRDGRLCISTMGELSKVLTPETQDEVLPRFFHLSKREAKAVAAE